MLTVTPAASAAVAAVLYSPQVPDGAGLRLQEGIDAAGQASIGIAIVDEPGDSDEHVPVDAGRELLVAQEVAGALDGQTLDAEIQDENVAFTIRPPSADGGPPAV
jgi:Fe-S cluster assembly iron-binding protein IscA